MTRKNTQLKKYVPDPHHVIILDLVEVAKNLMYEQCPIQILDYEVKQLCNKNILVVKVLWTTHNSSEAT